ncbi:MAG: hypothetical protein K9M02_15660 [Thiohalocapsa sp.]|nr:hypothetical protein [Thiohalocapsa sp.]
MSRYLLQVIILCLLSLVAVVMLSPPPAEKLELALSTMPAQEALAELDRVYAAGDRNPNLLMKRAELSLENADIAAARESLLSLAELQPHAVLAQERLATVARELGDLPTAVGHLAQAYALDPTPRRMGELAAAYRLLGRVEDERRLLDSVEPFALPPRLAQRLLELLRTRGEPAAMEVLLRARSELPAARRTHERGQLAELLIGSGRSAEAAATAAAWFIAEGDAGSLRTVTEALLRRGEVNAAEALSVVCLEADRDKAHVVIGAFAGAGYGARARSLLAEWLGERHRIDADAQAALLSYARQLNDYAVPLALMRLNGDETFTPDFILGVIKGSYRRFGRAALGGVLAHATPRVLASDPLFAAELALDLSRHSIAARYLLIASARIGLEPWQRARIAELTSRLQPPALRLQIAKSLLRESNA